MWTTLSKYYFIDDFYVVVREGMIEGTFILVDHDPMFWPELEKRTVIIFSSSLCSLKCSGKWGSKVILDYFKEEGKHDCLKDVRLDCRSEKTKWISFYEGHEFELVKEKMVQGHLMSLYKFEL